MEERTAPPADGDHPVAYATFTRRLRALVIDSGLVAGWAVAVVLLTDTFATGAGAGRAAVLALFGGVLLYEPVMVSRFGGTFGHRASNLRVVADATGTNPGFGRAALRFAIKSVLGILSFVTMAVTRRHQAVHDSLTRTTVQVRDLGLAEPDEYVEERLDLEPTGMPSRARRAIVSLAYVAALFVLLSLTVGLVLSPECMADESGCGQGERALQSALSVAWLAASALSLIGCWRGWLPGCRPRRTAPALGEPSA